MENNLENRPFFQKNYQILHGNCQKELRVFSNQVDLIITSPPYADARKQHYNSIPPSDYADWFVSFHSTFWSALKPTGSLVLNMKNKIVNGVRHRYVWETIEKLRKLGWYCIDDYIWHKKNQYAVLLANSLTGCLGIRIPSC